MVAYNPKPLGIEPLTQVVALSPRIEDGKFVLVLGAGVSIGAPTCLPSGPELALNVKATLLDGPLAGIVQPVDGDSLLAIADTVEKQSAASFPAFTRTILESADFRGALPNYAHLAITLLMAETNAPVLSTNWDTCIERASHITTLYIVPCTCREHILNAGNSTLLLKLHGCATDESSIRVSSRQIAEETWWAASQVGVAIESGFIAFLGIGSIAQYIRLSVQKVLDMSKHLSKLSNVLIVNPVLGEDWSQLLKDANEQNIAISSEEFLDEILRTLTLSQLSRANALARELIEEFQPNIDIEVATSAVIDFFRKFPAHFIWLWIRRGFFSTGPNPSVLDPAFKEFVIGLALINQVSSFSDFEIVGDTAFVSSEDFIIEFAWARDRTSARTLSRKKLASLSTDKKRHFLPQDKCFLVVAHGAIGALPSSTMKESIIDERHQADLIDGPDTISVRWIKLEDLTATREEDRICQMVGVEVND